MSAPRLLHLARRAPTPASRLVGRRFQSTGGDDKFKKSFHGQLYESTARRVQAERLQQSRRIPGGDDAKVASGGTISRIFTLAFVAGGFYYLGTLSQPGLPTTSTTPLSSVTPPAHNLSKSNLQASWTEFVRLLGADHVSTRNDDLATHSTSSWSTHQNPPDAVPFLVVYPSTTEEVSAIAKICHERRIPMTAFSGGTSLEGHFAPTRGGVCIDFSRMDKILSIHKDDLDVVVQPAVGWEYLNEILATDGLFFPPDPGPGAQIGGMVGTGCSGTNAAKYGTMREWVLSLTVVLADGTVIKTRQRPRKSSAGYDLTRMFIGSEGTLGLVTEATLKLAVKPASESVAVSSFPSIKAAAEMVAEVIGKGIPIAAIEILDDVMMKCINDSGTTARNWKEEPTLFFKFAGTAAGVKEQIAIIKAIGKTHGSKSFEFARTKEEEHDLWSARKEALWSMMALKRTEDDHVWTTDVAVPMSRLAEIIEETKADMFKNNILGSIVGHVGDGNFHAIFLYNDRERRTAEDVVHRMIKRAIEMEGTITGEHGIGLVKRDYLQEELGEDTVNAMRRLKQSFDPLWLLNCDKVVRVEAKK